MIIIKGFRFNKKYHSLFGKKSYVWLILKALDKRKKLQCKNKQSWLKNIDR